MTVLFLSIGRMPFLAPTLDNADPLQKIQLPRQIEVRNSKGETWGKMVVENV